MQARRFGRGPAGWLAAAIVLVAPAVAAAQPGAFNYPPIGEAILSAEFVLDTAELNAHRFFAGLEINHVELVDVAGVLAAEDLSTALFGVSAFPAPPLVDQPPTATGLLVAGVSPAFFPALAGGSVGLRAVLTDSIDAAFAIDTIRLHIVTALTTIDAHYGSANDGFGLGIPDGGFLPGPLPASLPPGSTGTGFDETISTKSINVVPEPAAIACGVAAYAWLLRRRESPSS
ncbi:MAG: hypothetical protein CHACPFDD_01770 [Phycisphaerae bacterium]|nr:hypothetical protein [Phycisphaerae bacterium]